MIKDISSINRVAGVDSAAIHSLCIEILEYKEKIRNVLQNITDSFEESKKYISGDLFDDFDRKYTELKSSYKIIEQNIDSYIDEYNSLLSSEELLDFELSNKIIAGISNLDNKGDENNEWFKYRNQWF